MSGEATPREVLIAAGLSSTLITADDGWPSIVSRSNEEAADLALAALSAKRLSVVPTKALDELLDAWDDLFGNEDGYDWRLGESVERKAQRVRAALAVWTETNR